MGWKPITFEWQWQLKSSPQDLWPYVADTQRFDQAARLPVADFVETPLETGGSQRVGRSSKFGVPVAWEEYPYEWVREQEYSIVRVFEQGPLARTYNRLLLEPNGQGTLVNYLVEAVPANLLGWLGIFYQVGWESRRNFEHVFREIDDFLQQRTEQPFTLRATPLTDTGSKRLQELAATLAGQGYEQDWVDRLVDLISREADLNLLRMRPNVYADAWQAPRRRILEMFLAAVRIGLLRLRWDVICPLCREAKASAPTLGELTTVAHCATCNIDYEANFSQSVEVTFSPHPQIRSLSADVTCIGGPMVTPHILVQQRLEPGETHTLTAKLEPGSYHLRTQRPGAEAWFELNRAPQGEPARLVVLAETDHLEVVGPESAGQETGDPLPVDVTMTNQATYPQMIYLERAEWYTNAVTAAQVTSLQRFRDLFSAEVLHPDEEIQIENMTVLFSDLVGSTSLYTRKGDAPSYALVREQFDFLRNIIREHDGAVVKTIGDAIMGAFVDPGQAVRAALTIQNEIPGFNATHPETPLTLRLGLNQGPCIAVNLNGRLDYFGSTVNLAARLEGQSLGGDVVISEALRRDPAVQEMLSSMPVRVERFEAALKGFDDRMTLYRLSGGAAQAVNSGASNSTAASISSPK